MAIVGLGLNCLTNGRGCSFSNIYSGDDSPKMALINSWRGTAATSFCSLGVLFFAKKWRFSRITTATAFGWWISNFYTAANWGRFKALRGWFIWFFHQYPIEHAVPGLCSPVLTLTCSMCFAMFDWNTSVVHFFELQNQYKLKKLCKHQMETCEMTRGCEKIRETRPNHSHNNGAPSSQLAL